MCCICRVLFPCCFSNKPEEDPLLQDPGVEGNIQVKHDSLSRVASTRPKTPEHLIGGTDMFKGAGTVSPIRADQHSTLDKV